MSSSHPIKMLSSASRMVTLEPRSARSEANSHPTTPPPTTATEAGSFFRSKNSSEVITQRPSTSNPRNTWGTDPDASTTLRPTTTRPASITVDHLDLVVRLERPGPDQRGHLAPLEQAGQALEELVDHRVLAVLAPGEVDRHAAHVDAELLGPLDRPVHGGRLQELLGRDAAAVQAGAAHLVPLDDGDREPGRRAVERRGVPARAATDHDDVELFLACHRLSSSSSQRRPPDALGSPENFPIAPARVVLYLYSARAPRQPTVRPTTLSQPAGSAFRYRRVRPRPACRPPSWPTRPHGRSSGPPSGP